MASEISICLKFTTPRLCPVLKLNRFLSCHFLFLLDERICSPPFMVLNVDCSTDVLEQIERQGLTFPFSKFWFYFVEMFQNRIVTHNRWLHWPPPV